MKELMLKRKGMLLCCAVALAVAALIGVGVAQANAADLEAVEDEAPAAVAVDDKKADAVDEAAVDEGALEGDAEEPAGEDTISTVAHQQEEDAIDEGDGGENVELVAVEEKTGTIARAEATDDSLEDNSVEAPENGEIALVDEAQGERIDEEPPELEECPASELD
ncbi:MAG: hypothetical protein UCH28_11275 [Adlercreutzia sp.]|nr:hypothetical protein [Adlercreutzia sp.]